MSGLTGIGLSEIFGTTNKRRNRRQIPSRHCERLEDRRLLSTVVQLYGGNHGISQPNPGPSGISPPDIAGAVGPSDLLQFTDAQYTDLNLTNGTYTHIETPTQFWSRVGIYYPTPYDTRAVYDTLLGRFVVVALSGVNSSQNKILLAVSANSSPDWGWYSFSFNANSTELGYQAYCDNLSMGVDLNGIYLSTKNYVVGSGLWIDASIFAMPTQPLLTSPPTTPPLSRWRAAYPSNGDWFQPATNLASGQTGTQLEYIVTTVFQNNTTYLEISSVNWSGMTPIYGGASLCTTYGAYSPPPNGTQPAGFPQLDAGGEVRVQNAVVADGNLWTVFSCNINGNASAVITQTGLGNLTAVAQFDWLHQDGVDIVNPTIAVNNAGWVTVGATEVSPSIYPTAIVAGRRYGDPANTLSPIGVIEWGAVGYTGAFVPGSSSVVKWGEYSTTFVDPTNDYTFWTIQQDSVSSSVANNWTSRFEEFGLAPSGSASTSGGVLIGPPVSVTAATPLDAAAPADSSTIASDWKKDLLARPHKRHAKP